VSLAVLREAHGAGGPLQQPRTDALFHALDQGGDGGARNLQVFRGLGEALALGDTHEGLHFLEAVHRASSIYCLRNWNSVGDCLLIIFRREWSTIRPLIHTRRNRTMNSSRHNQVAIVTGASRGIGAAVAQRLARDGFAVAINYASGSTRADALVAELTAAGARTLAVQADVANAEEVRRMFDAVEKQLGQVDVLVNNAGVLKTVPLAEHSDALYDQSFDINVRGTFNTLREAATRLGEGGRIVNFSSTTLALNMPGYAIYNATKAAVEAFTHVFAKELRGRNITVNAVAPGPIATSLFLDGKTDEQIRTFAKMPPLQRLGQPEDIASVVSFLAGPDAGWVNGQILRANGGVA
jgi:3-oxoacyl-[acyl-carrier protein] reductase